MDKGLERVKAVEKVRGVGRKVQEQEKGKLILKKKVGGWSVDLKNKTDLVKEMSLISLMEDREGEKVKDVEDDVVNEGAEGGADEEFQTQSLDVRPKDLLRVVRCMNEVMDIDEIEEEDRERMRNWDRETEIRIREVRRMVQVQVQVVEKREDEVEIEAGGETGSSPGSSGRGAEGIVIQGFKELGKKINGSD